MKKGKVFWAMLSFIVVLAMVLSACAQEAAPTPTATAPVPTATQANWWDKLGEPQYGGTLTYRFKALNAVFDPYYPNDAGGTEHYMYERLFMPNWTTDRNEWDFKTNWFSTSYAVGCLLESWEWPDQQTMSGHIRKGVHWQDKPPANGRELTADDVVFHYDRVFGTGSGFTTPNPVLSAWGAALEEATATDKYTVVFKFKQPSLYINFNMVDDISTLDMIECPDVVTLGRDPNKPSADGAGTGINDWRNACGTGPYILTDFATDSSLTLSRNPNYWGYDERHPKNQLPYTDTVKILCIPDTPTALAALRTGKVDLMDSIDWQQAKSLAQSNPELQQSRSRWAGVVLNMRCDTKPFTDINVRKALQMSVDLETIANSYYGGSVDGTPCGLMNPMYKGWYTPYNEWPKDLQEEYSYNPTKAKQLLADAGYPNGFMTNLYARNTDDLQLLQVMKSYFKDVGVDMEIKTFDGPTFMGLIGDRKQDQMATASWLAFPRPPWISASDLLSNARGNSSVNNDPVYDGLVARQKVAQSEDEAKKLTIEIDMYVLQHHWGVVALPLSVNTIWQPYVKGYTGESLSWIYNVVFPRLWIDQDQKKSMGR
jgi:peptide/nickel transport system substrate-binding protein